MKYRMQKLYADIIVDISLEKLDKTFQYAVPDELRERVGIGTKVDIPFGNGTRRISGYVVGLGETPKIDEGRIKPILGIANQGITIENHLIELAAYISSHFGSTMNQALQTVLPVKEKVKKKKKKELLF